MLLAADDSLVASVASPLIDSSRLGDFPPHLGVLELGEKRSTIATATVEFKRG
jgi:hypothetical protein